MKNLILVRHAKSSWKNPLLDKERPLTLEGIKKAHLVASHTKEFLPKTYTIWSSTAERASATALIFAQNWALSSDSILYKEALYTFDEKKLEKIIKSSTKDHGTIIIFGHNEAITNFVNKFGNVSINNVPTAGFVHLEFDSDNWDSINKGITKKIVFPRDLK